MEKIDDGLTNEQREVVNCDKHKLIVSASAGSGKTFVLIEYLIRLISKKHVPVSRMLVLTFTKASANEMKTRLNKAILSLPKTDFLTSQIDDIEVSDICTIDAFCEHLLKKNAINLSIDPNFVTLDKEESEKLKRTAFERTYEKFFSEKIFDEIYFSFKKK